MAGIRVSRLPSIVTERHLKIYFENTRNGGGKVEKILYPLPFNSAVLMFQDENVVARLLEPDRKHQLMNTQIDVHPLPRNVFRSVVVEVNPRLCKYLWENHYIIDDLQYIGELEINMEETDRVYSLSGAWYQVEWALHYLNTSMDIFEHGDDSSLAESHALSGSKEVQMSSAKLKSSSDTSAKNFEIKHPNIPMVNRSDQASAQQMTNSKQKSTAEGAMASDQGIGHSGKKNKNALPKSTAFNNSETPQGMNYNNLDEDYAQTPMNNQRGENEEDSSDDDFFTNPGAFANRPTMFDPRNFVLVDSDNEDAFQNFNFDADLQSVIGGAGIGGRWPMLEKTKGTDVSEAHFGDIPSDFSFDLTPEVKVHVAIGDITQQRTDAIVNPTNSMLAQNASAVSRSIFGKGGDKMKQECQQYLEEMKDLGVSMVMHTSAGGSLNPNVNFILHVNGPHWAETDRERVIHMLICSYLNCLLHADQRLWLHTLSTPLINTGPYGFPLDESVQAFFDALLLFSTTVGNEVRLRNLHLVCYDQDTAMAVIVILRSLLDCKMSEAAVSASDRYLSRKMDFDFDSHYYKLSCNNRKNNPDTKKDNGEGKEPKANDSDDEKIVNDLNSDEDNDDMNSYYARQPVTSVEGDIVANTATGDDGKPLNIATNSTDDLAEVSQRVVGDTEIGIIERKDNEFNEEVSEQVRDQRKPTHKDDVAARLESSLKEANLTKSVRRENDVVDVEIPAENTEDSLKDESEEEDINVSVPEDAQNNTIAESAKTTEEEESKTPGLREDKEDESFETNEDDTISDNTEQRKEEDTDKITDTTEQEINEPSDNEQDGGVAEKDCSLDQVVSNHTKSSMGTIAMRESGESLDKDWSLVPGVADDKKDENQTATKAETGEDTP